MYATTLQNRNSVRRLHLIIAALMAYYWLNAEYVIGHRLHEFELALLKIGLS